jgi:ATP-dependent Clp protease adaptor protein ClpS
VSSQQTVATQPKQAAQPSPFRRRERAAVAVTVPPAAHAATMNAMAEQGRPGEQGAVLTEPKAKTARPRRWKVLLHNDDYTTMEFVVYVLVRHFGRSHAEATHVMLQVHHKGVGVAGVYPKDVAESKAAVVTAEAREQGMPLVLSTEPE